MRMPAGKIADFLLRRYFQFDHAALRCDEQCATQPPPRRNVFAGVAAAATDSDAHTRAPLQTLRAADSAATALRPA